ncbi:MAG TPA: Hsp20/alpha crystallin family protein [Dehalococcoidia bacterium]|nr:Hsp20/alpha crystallin family protein [Dehalococcoidia bacterium]
MSTERGRFRRGAAPYRPIPELQEMRRRFEEDVVRPFMHAAPFRPIPELEEMRRRFEEDIVRPVMHAVWERIPEEQKGWAPPIDVIERNDNFVVRVELPGMKQEDIDVSVSDDTLTIKGERKPESGIKGEDYDRSEIAYGSFYRSVVLPSSVDNKNIEAIYEDGILRVTLQRASGAKPKRVTVQVKKGTA